MSRHRVLKSSVLILNSRATVLTSRHVPQHVALARSLIPSMMPQYVSWHLLEQIVSRFRSMFEEAKTDRSLRRTLFARSDTVN